MFSDNMALYLAALCQANGLSLSAAAEQCNISTRQFGAITRRQTIPSVFTLEKICNGFGRTPNEMLCAEPIPPELTYREGMHVSRIYKFPCHISSSDSYVYFPVCPRCGITMEREYQPFCDRCGQRLNWAKYGNATVV